MCANELEMANTNSKPSPFFFNFIPFLTLEDESNKPLSICYVIFIIGSLAYLIFLILKKTVLVTTQDICNELFAAIDKKDTIKCVNIIKKYPQLINMFCGNSRYTPFLRACLNAHTQLVKYMIREGANVNLKSLNGENGIYLTAYYHVKYQDVMDATCLHALFYAGVNINQPNAKGWTALHLASFFGHHRLVRWLLNKGADPNVLPSPYLLAREQGHLLTTSVFRAVLPVTNSNNNNNHHQHN
ncbi:putative ankyrin repeat protein RBE_0347 [Onthophagus taurus]|uniref:putative ankyrin repeat protein RBE_0347 n=1 Tax=Onthophagus taurus TaxID=166361 RepID=UPI0039BDF471